MSTPSPVPLDNFDSVSPYAPKRGREQIPDIADEPTEPPAELRHPAGIETDHDARILDEIEASLRAMIESHRDDSDSARLADVSRAAAEKLAAECEQRQADEEEEPHYAAPHAAPPAAADPRRDMPAPAQLAADMAEVRAAFRDPRTPPWLLARSLDPLPVPEPLYDTWPQPRKSSRWNAIFLRFGLGATGAAVVAAIAIKDVPTLVMEYVRVPIAELSTNAAAVFNEGKASGLQERMDAVQKEKGRAPAPALRYTVASADPQAAAIAVKTEAIARAPEPRRESVMTPWPSPEIAKRGDPAGWQMPPAVQTQPPPPDPASAAPAPRALTEEEITMLRKMGDDYISNGDFVGARAVLERAADAGDASAAFAIASTYDPVVLTRFKVRGLEPDIVKASFWYERARELGSPEAPHRLQAMMAARAN